MAASWNIRPSECSGAAYFRGPIAPRAEEFIFLNSPKVKTCKETPTEREAWAVRVSHPQWGGARVASLRKPTPVPEILVKYDARLDKTEKADALLGQSSVHVQLNGDKGDILHDRKRLLRFLYALMEDDGLIAVDATATRFWSRAALADELCHDADLDIDSLFTVHAITDGLSNKVNWYHTHGLGEMGFFDFDVVRPSPDLLTSRCHDFARAIAFAIVEGKVQTSTPMARLISGGPIRLVDVAEFNRKASKEDRALRGDDEFHNQNRTVLCDPASPRWFSKIVGVSAQPSRLLSAPQGDFMVFFPTNATRLMARRARQTYKMFRQLTSEFAELKVKPIVKLGYPIDGGKPDQLEHMWFEVHELHDDTIDATLANTPKGVSSLVAGQRGMHPLDQLTDWMLIGPTGSITPRDTRPARTARLHREEILKRLHH